MTNFAVAPCGDGRLPEIKLVTCRRHTDPRGYLVETFKRADLAAMGVDLEIRQENQSLSFDRYTIRGLHFQAPPCAQAKLVRVVKGTIYDVAVDVRADSATFGQWVATELSKDEPTQLFVPRGFAHGYCTLTPNTIVVYAMDNVYTPDCEYGIIWNDPDIAIDWPIGGATPVLSLKDSANPRLATLPPFFAGGT